ncbi:MAG: ABC transporter ATP-binding protein [Pseudomonadota bacterium]
MSQPNGHTLRSTARPSAEHMEDLAQRYPAVPTLRRLLAENAKVHAPWYFAAFALMAITAGATAGTAWVIKDVINEIFIEQQIDMVLPIALTIVAIFTVKGISSYGTSVILARTSAKVLAGLKKKIIGKVLAQGVAFFDRMATGEITARFNQNASAARQAITQILQQGLRDAMTLVALGTVMVLQDPVLSLISVLIVPPALLGLGWIGQRVRGLARLEFQSVSKIMQLVTESVRGVRIIKAFNLETARRHEIEEAIEEVEQRTLQVSRYNAITLPLADSLGGIGIALIVIYGGYAVIGQGGDAGAFFSFITAFLMAYEPATRLGKLNVALQRSLIGVRLMFELLDEPLSLQNAKGAKDLEVPNGAIRFENVGFSYLDTPALSGLDLDIRAGEFMAIVGPSGAGKSTLFNMLTRFYDPQHGAITIDGQDIASVTLTSLRDSIAVVTQDPYLFSGTIRENIMMGDQTASAEMFDTVVKAARVSEFCDAMPEGFDAEVGEGGARLSGGQRQRVAIARAMLRDAPILLLDEATSALDSESEAKVQQALEELRKGRTALVIAHRLSTVRNADRVAVIKDGRVEEIGTHADLLAKSGVFRALHDFQFKPATKASAQKTAV